MTDHKDNIYMKRCFELAALGLPNVMPNPLAGSVIVHEDRIIGEGYHMQYGAFHAEKNAIESVKEKALLPHATIYINLEPCAHKGKQPPCTGLIIASEIPRVVISNIDSNEKVSGKGVETLKRAGVSVKTGVLEEQGRELNRRFFIYHEKKRPYLILKWAQTADGYIDYERPADAPVRPTWITDEFSRMLVHKWRSEEAAIMVGRVTTQKDNPGLTNREWYGKSPVRILIDKDLKIQENHKLYDGMAPTLIFNCKKAGASGNIHFEKIAFGGDVLHEIMTSLYAKKLQSVIIEGGAGLIQSLIDAGYWDEARVFTGEKYFHWGVKAPDLKQTPLGYQKIKGNRLYYYRNYTPAGT